MNFEEHCEMAETFYATLQEKAKRKYGDNRSAVTAYELGYLRGTIQSLWINLNLTDEQKELFVEYFRVHSK